MLQKNGAMEGPVLSDGEPSYGVDRLCSTGPSTVECCTMEGAKL